MLGVCGSFKTGRFDSFLKGMGDCKRTLLVNTGCVVSLLKGMGDCKRAVLVNTECVVSLWREGEYGDKLVGLSFNTECAEPLMLEKCDESWSDSVSL